MKNTNFVVTVFTILLCGMTMFVSGCTPFIKADDIWCRTEETTKMFYVDITSDPDDADVWFNNQLIGKTPLRSYPLVITTEYSRFNVVGETSERPKGEYIIRVSKEGYLDATGKLSFQTLINKGRGYYTYDLLNKNLDFKLEPRSAKTITATPTVASFAPSSQATTGSTASHTLHLEGIIESREGSIAVINAQAVKVGDKVNGNLIVDIRKDRVVLYDGEKNFEIFPK